jgi:hypothetical protein
MPGTLPAGADIPTTQRAVKHLMAAEITRGRAWYRLSYRGDMTHGPGPVPRRSVLR